MTKLGRSKTIRFLVFGLLVLAATSCAQKRAPAPQQRSSVPKQTARINTEQIAKTYGLDSFGQIDGIRYTFNIQFPGVNVSRSWEWEPKTGKVSYEGKDKDDKPVKVSYMRSELSSQPDAVKNGIEPAFTNDNYWLLFPLHAYWDTSATVTDQGMQKLPLGNGSAELVAVKYPSEGGYTPGDTWDLYVGKESNKPSVVAATWEGYKKAGPLLISTDHHGTADGQPLQVFFSDVSVKLTGSDTWVKTE